MNSTRVQQKVISFTNANRDEAQQQSLQQTSSFVSSIYRHDCTFSFGIQWKTQSFK